MHPCMPLCMMSTHDACEPFSVPSLAPNDKHTHTHTHTQAYSALRHHRTPTSPNSHQDQEVSHLSSAAVFPEPSSHAYTQHSAVGIPSLHGAAQARAEGAERTEACGHLAVPNDGTPISLGSACLVRHEKTLVPYASTNVSRRLVSLVS